MLLSQNHKREQNKKSNYDKVVEITEQLEKIDLEILEYVSDIRENPEALEKIAELIKEAPDYEVVGEMPKEIETKINEQKPMKRKANSR